MDHRLEVLASFFFVAAIFHTFLAPHFIQWSHHFPKGTWQNNFFHVVGEVEVAFGIWAALFLIVMSLVSDKHTTLETIEKMDFTEPLFIFVIMAVAATRPLIDLTRFLILRLGFFSPFSKTPSVYALCLFAGPLMGSLITEPAAMTVTALVLKDLFFHRNISIRFKYLTLAVLFVNISVGGVLTHFAAPPVVMVAHRWSWDTPYMFSHFGYKAIVIVALNTILALWSLRQELTKIEIDSLDKKFFKLSTPLPLIFIHTMFLLFIVINSHHPKIFISALLFFLGLMKITHSLQDRAKLPEAALVGFFLAGIVVLGSFQSWWLSPLLQSLNDLSLFIGTTLLTAVTDNAALTYLGAQVPDLPITYKHALLEGAVTGGGLTVIANAPNPVGYAILNSYFGEEGIKPLSLLKYAAVPTLITSIFFWFLPL